MGIMVTVEKEIDYSKNYPDQCITGGDWEGTDACRYYKERDRFHGKKGIERGCPKCTLFDEWLSGKYVRCERCKEAIRESMEGRNE